MGDLLRAVRVVGPVLRLMGRYRAATWISLVLAVGWLVVGFAPRGDAATGTDTLTNGTDSLAHDLGRTVSVWITLGALAYVVAVGALASCAYNAATVRIAGRAMRHDPESGFPDVPNPRVDSDARVSWVADGARLETLIDAHSSPSRLP